jgi:hypothetical protein
MARWMYTCFIASPPTSRDEIMATLMKERGMDKDTAASVYRNYWLRFVAYRQRLASLQDRESLDSL